MDRGFRRTDRRAVMPVAAAATVHRTCVVKIACSRVGSAGAPPAVLKQSSRVTGRAEWNADVPAAELRAAGGPRLPPPRVTMRGGGIRR